MISVSSPVALGFNVEHEMIRREIKKIRKIFLMFVRIYFKKYRSRFG